MKKIDLQTKEYDNYYLRYIDKLSDDISLRKGFEEGKKNVVDFFKSVPKEKLEYRYSPEKWSIKEIFQHLIDTERIFMYRCFRIARRDITPLAGYDQNIYIAPSEANNKSLDDLLKEFTLGRTYSMMLLDSLSDENLSFIGNSNGGKMSARAAAFTIIGHDIWHLEVIKEKYL